MQYIPKIGAYVLETLTTGMYSNPLDSIREYVQNASDSIRTAEENNILRKGEGRIEIKLDYKNSVIKIRDNGLGVSKDDIEKKLIDIGMSDKHFETNAGFRGIGRLAGMAYCDKLYFRTSSNGEKTNTTIEIDCNNLKKSIVPSMRQAEELINVIGKFSSQKSELGTEEEHFLEVILEGIDPSVSELFLDFRVLEKYLCQVAPIKMDTQHFVYAPKITEWIKQNQISLPVSTLVIKTNETEREIFKPYKTHYRTQKGNYDIKIRGICCYPEKLSEDSSYWLWYGKTELLGTIDDNRVAGFRFRKHNIAIGPPDRVSELFSDISESYYRFNAWYIGEIHILDKNVIPNARRDGFESNDAWESLKNQLKIFIRERCSDAYQTSQARNIPLPKVIRSSQKVLEETSKKLKTGFISLEEQNLVLAKVKKEEEKVNKVIESQKDKPSEKLEELTTTVVHLVNLKKELEENNHLLVNSLKPEMDRKQRKLLGEILQLLNDVLDETNYNKAQTAIINKYKVVKKNE